MDSLKEECRDFIMDFFMEPALIPAETILEAAKKQFTPEQYYDAFLPVLDTLIEEGVLVRNGPMIKRK